MGVCVSSCPLVTGNMIHNYVFILIFCRNLKQKEKVADAQLPDNMKERYKATCFCINNINWNKYTIIDVP